MGSLFSRPKVPTLATSAPITRDTAEVQAAVAAESVKIRRRNGYKSTIMTGPEGVTTPATTLKATLG